MKHPDYVPCEGWVVLDIGTYVGIYTLWAAKKVGDEDFVTAFEPNPLAFRWLINNIELNALRSVKVLPYALGDKVVKSILHVADKNIGASSLIRDHVINNPPGKYSIINEFNVQVLTLDYVIERATTIVERAIDNVDLAKIDVEGYEMRVLKGMTKALDKGSVERLVVEVHVDQVSTKNLMETLAKYNYKPEKLVKFDNIKDIVYIRLRY
jgi:FkbM family methyltransferase